MRRLIDEYKITLRRVNKARTEATNKDDKSILSSCADSLSFSIKYMEKGKHPDSRRGITRLSGEQREIPVDPRNEAFVRAVALQNQPSGVSEKMQRAIDDLGIVLNALSAKEQEAYSLVKGSGYSFGAAATIMGIQKATVQVLVRRAQDKICGMVLDLTNHGIIFRKDIQMEMF